MCSELHPDKHHSFLFGVYSRALPSVLSLACPTFSVVHVCEEFSYAKPEFILVSEISPFSLAILDRPSHFCFLPVDDI